MNMLARTSPNEEKSRSMAAMTYKRRQRVSSAVNKLKGLTHVVVVVLHVEVQR